MQLPGENTTKTPIEVNLKRKDRKHELLLTLDSPASLFTLSKLTYENTIVTFPSANEALLYVKDLGIGSQAAVTLHKDRVSKKHLAVKTYLNATDIE